MILKDIMSKYVKILGPYTATNLSESPPSPLYRALAGLDREGSFGMSSTILKS